MSRTFGQKRIMGHPTQPKDNSDSNPEEPEKNLVNLWFAVAVIGLFVCLFLRPKGSCRPLSSDRVCKFSWLSC